MDLNNVLSICHTLESVLVDAFGPRGLKTMITTSTGKVIVTSNGATVLGALNLSHPLAKLIITSANEVSNCQGTGFKTFIFYITGAIETLAKLCENHCPRSDKRAEFRLKVAQTLNHLIHQNLSCTLDEALTQQSVNNVPKFKNCQEIYYQIIHTELSCSFPPRQVEHFTKLLNSFILKVVNGHLDVVSNLSVVVNSFKELFIKINTQPFTDSRIVDGILLAGEFSVFVDRQLNGDPVKFIVLQSNLQRDEDLEKYNIEIKCEKVLENSLNQKREILEDFIKVCKLYGINVIFSREKMSGCFLYLCRINQISVVEFVSDQDVNRLTRVCQVETIHDIKDLVEGNVCQAASCSSVRFGGLKFIQVSLTKKEPNIGMAQVLVCSLGNSQCEEVYQAFNTCVKIVSNVIIPCGFQKGSNTVEIAPSTIEDKIELPTNEDKIGPSTIEDKIGPSTIEDTIEFTTAEDKTGPSSIESKTRSTTIEHKAVPSAIEHIVGPSTITDKIGPAAIVDTIRPSTIDGKIRPSAVEDRTGPSTIENKIRPSTIGDKIRSSTIENKIGPSTIEDEIGPFTNENKIGPSTIEDNIGPSTIVDKIGPSTIEDKTGPHNIKYICEEISYSTDYASVIQGGGAFELFMEHYVNNLCDKSDNLHFKLACEVIIGAVSKVPQCLLKNSNKQAQKLFIEKRKRIFEQIAVGYFQSVNSYTGVVERFHDSFECIPVKVSVLLKALKLISQILRLY